MIQSEQLAYRTKRRHNSVNGMKFMTFNSLLMFDVVFIFFLFLVGVSCIVYYLPTPRRRPDADGADSYLVNYVTAVPSKKDRDAPVDDV